MYLNDVQWCPKLTELHFVHKQPLHIKRDHRFERDFFSDAVIRALTHNFPSLADAVSVGATAEFIRITQRIFNIFEKVAIVKDDDDHIFLKNNIPYLQYLSRENRGQRCWFGLCISVEAVGS